MNIEGNQITFEADDERLELLESIHPIHRNSAINFALLLLSNHGMTNQFFKKPLLDQDIPLKDANSIDVGLVTLNDKTLEPELKPQEAPPVTAEKTEKPRVTIGFDQKSY